MRRWLVAGVAGVVLLVAAGFVLTFIPRLRRAADDLGCANHLREIGLFAAHHVDPKVGGDPARYPTEIPAGTFLLAAYPPDERLSWFPRVLPGLDQKRQNAEPLLAGLKQLEPFAAVPNQAVARTRLLAALCPANPPPPDPSAPAPTCYVGIAGLGADAATLALPDPPAPAPPRAGCFRYDRPTPFSFVTDGLSQTLMFGERSGDLGPWLRGGPATVRGLDDSPAAPPLVGRGGQFGGNHGTGANWGYADGSVRFFTDRIDPRVLFSLATIAGRESDPLPGE
jgi:prepilin-type processing-associated H-X9-DG protein